MILDTATEEQLDTLKIGYTVFIIHGSAVLPATVTKITKEVITLETRDMYHKNKLERRKTITIEFDREKSKGVRKTTKFSLKLLKSDTGKILLSLISVLSLVAWFRPELKPLVYVLEMLADLLS